MIQTMIKDILMVRIAETVLCTDDINHIYRARYFDPKKIGIVNRLLGHCATISPIVLHRKWTRGVAVNTYVPLLPGYVLLYFSQPLDCRMFRESTGLITIDALDEEDEYIARWLLECNGELGLSKGRIMGDKVRFIEGPLVDVSEMVRRVDRHRKRAMIEFRFCGVLVKATLDYEWA
jgi:hypothetical protein